MVSTTIPISGSNSGSGSNSDDIIKAESAPQIKDSTKVKPYAWIVNPWFDTMFVFGGALWLLFGLHFFVFGWNPRVELPWRGAFAVSTLLIILSTLGQHLFADSHTVSTYMRIYATPESRKTFKLYAYYLPWCSLSLWTMALLYREAAGMVIYIHLMWVFQHYVGQCYGIGLIYCYKQNYFMSKFERETFRWWMHSLSYFVIIRILTQRDFSPYFYYGVEVPFWGLPIWLYKLGEVFLATMCILFAACIVRKYHRDKQFIPLPCLAVVGTVWAIGLSTGMASAMVWIYGPPFFHGSQYLAVSLGYYIKEKGLPEGMIPKEIFVNWFKPRALKYWAYVIMAGMFIYVFLPHFLMYFGLSFALGASTIQACINFHHFVSDAAIWRLRDPKCRDVLIA